MKKLLLVTLFTLGLGLAVVDADARYRNSNCGTCARSCETACEVIEEPRPTPPCCLTAVEVPAKAVKHISWSYYCPKGCRSTGGESSFME